MHCSRWLGRISEWNRQQHIGKRTNVTKTGLLGMMVIGLKSVLWVFAGRWSGSLGVVSQEAIALFRWPGPGTRRGLQAWCRRGAGGQRERQVIPSVEEAAKGKTQVENYGGQEPQAPAFQSSSQYRPAQLALVHVHHHWCEGPQRIKFLCVSESFYKTTGSPLMISRVVLALTLCNSHVITKRRLNGTSFPITNILYTRVKEKPSRLKIQMCRIMYEKIVYIHFLFEKPHIEFWAKHMCQVLKKWVTQIISFHTCSCSKA